MLARTLSLWFESSPRKVLQSPHNILARSLPKEFVSSNSPLKILEVGCGSGFLTFPLAHALPMAQIFAIDSSKSMMACFKSRVQQHTQHDKEAEKRLLKQIHPSVSDVHNLQFPDGHFDGAVMVTAFPQFKDKVKALSELHRVLKRTGFLATSESIIDPHFLRFSVIKMVTRYPHCCFQHALVWREMRLYSRRETWQVVQLYCQDV